MMIVDDSRNRNRVIALLSEELRVSSHGENPPTPRDLFIKNLPKMKLHYIIFLNALCIYAQQVEPSRSSSASGYQW
jgi:hypothetical protein